MVGWCSMGTFNDPCHAKFPNFWVSNGLHTSPLRRWLPTKDLSAKGAAPRIR